MHNVFNCLGVNQLNITLYNVFPDFESTVGNVFHVFPDLESAVRKDPADAREVPPGGFIPSSHRRNHQDQNVHSENCKDLISVLRL